MLGCGQKALGDAAGHRGEILVSVVAIIGHKSPSSRSKRLLSVAVQPGAVIGRLKPYAVGIRIDHVVVAFCRSRKYKW